MRLEAFATLALFALAAAAGPAAAETVEEAGARLMREERIGDLQLGMPEAGIAKVIRAKPQRSREIYEAADGMFRQRWTYGRQGLKLTLATEKKGTPRKLDAILCTAGCGLRTSRGIGIGSAEADVNRAYAKEFNKEESKAGVFVAGSIYGGLIVNFKAGKVSALFLGAAAE